MQMLWDDGERTLTRMTRCGDEKPCLIVRSVFPQSSYASAYRLSHEYGLKDELSTDWALQPLELVREAGEMALVLGDSGGEPLLAVLNRPLEIQIFLPLAIEIAASLAKLHQSGLIHKDVKPAHVIINCNDGRARFTGFGLASRLPRERQLPEPPETIAGTLAYMAPEQTGRMNRSIDSRCDLYACGVLYYQMLTGGLPFTAQDPMGWVHCHIAKRPAPFEQKVGGVPGTIARIVMRLLAKTPEERYQTAKGLECDLRRCWSEWQADGSISNFGLDKHRSIGRLMIPEKLYGREGDVDKLVAAFDRVVSGGTPELVLVSGYSGVGKSSVVGELHKVLVPPRGLFAAGKFDQYKRNIPYSTLIQAFQALIHSLLGKSDIELAGWRALLVDALTPNARLLTDLIPELKLIIGEPSPVAALEPQQAQRRFMQVFRRFIGVFARAEHPLALFLDDLQWLDVATLDLLEDLLTTDDVRHLLLIGAYRNNEVNYLHPLPRKLVKIREAGARIDEITLAPLNLNQTEQLIAETLHSSRPQVRPLARLVHGKTDGNPFFTIQFLYSLAEEDLLTFDHGARQWHWMTEGIHAKGYTDNVADLMLSKLTRLPRPTQDALQQLACLGHHASATALALVLEMEEERVHTLLWDAFREGFVERSGTDYVFMHDRVHEAAYLLMAQDKRASAHLRIGRLIAASNQGGSEDSIFDIVSQLNRASELIIGAEEREQLANFNLMAGLRAKASTAYISASAYFASGLKMLGETSSQDVRFALELNQAECEMLTGRLSESEARLELLSQHARNMVERASVTCLQVDVYLLIDDSARAVRVSLDYLRQAGVNWSEHPDNKQVELEYRLIWTHLGDRTIESLLDQPIMRNADILATLEVLSRMFAPAVQADANLAALTICKAVSLSLEWGNCDASSMLYANVGRVSGPRFGDWERGLRFGQLGCDLVDHRELKRFEASTRLCFSNFVVRWMKPVRECRPLLDKAFEAANSIGDLAYGSFTRNALISDLLYAGDPLAAVQADAEQGLEYVRGVGFGLITDVIKTQLMLIRMLRGQSPEFGRLADDLFDERTVEAKLEASPGLIQAFCWFQVRLLQARFLAGDFEGALTAGLKAKQSLWSSASFYEEAEYHFFDALARAALCEDRLCEVPSSHISVMKAHYLQLQIWAEQCPENFASRHQLLGAEIARVEGRFLAAEHGYELAIRRSQESQFLHIEALANELAARFYSARGMEKVAGVYMRDARYAYVRWGAEGKARQLDSQFPLLNRVHPPLTPEMTITAPVEHLDLATVLKIAQTVSSEIILEKLIDKIMRLAIEQAGAERGVLILSTGETNRVVGEVSVGFEETRLQDVPVTSAFLPESVLYRVLRSGEHLILDDAVSAQTFATDPYIQRRRPRSLLCMPLMHQARLTGALYLENTMVPHVFSPSRVAVLKLIAAQAAVSLENARLYRVIEARESKIRRLVEANIIGIVVWNTAGEIVEANDAFLRLLGYERDEIERGLVRWRDMTPQEFKEISEWSMSEAVRTGTARPFEKAYLHKNGLSVPVIVGLAMFEASRQEGVAFVVDLSERKRAEEQMRDSERRYREMQTELAHANRVATMGQLVASIVHEVSQPIAATLTGVGAAQRWLEIGDTAEVKSALGQVVQNGHRAADVITRIRGLITKQPHRKECVDLDAAIREVIEITRGQAVKNRCSINVSLQKGVPPIKADRVELQQVLINLVINALEAMASLDDDQRELSISTNAGDDGNVSVTVSDTGPGFSSLDHDQIFAPFYTTKTTGLGMGLSICRSIIEGLGGQLGARVNVPRGAVIHFVVPGAQ
ncbi:AAA family ATPase [Pseudomonas sp. NPDC090208]|uniref:trifunctional serine/threonine-protein kinase/ATP-binding protein/sensor histidine kinase n=1 Tax=Pseudomonas sp. NPDC090208 TaxID=3364478 RepID=UPI0038065087